MVKRSKLLHRILNNPKDVRFNDLRSILLHYGFVERQPRGGSSHYTYRHGEYIITLPRSKLINKVYVMKVIKILKELNII